ncbi:IPT/TIG domain-containing protein [Acidovorax sp. 107]|uniref:IPT/TIG domain-containing protein n=1 Tax=Acidovorax sp. 107 TaxID=2135638 RepID=UPI000D335BD1|nr:IPT/TIG domain-containing protein [Acidovorax sp. 107]PUA98040.1 IPT/TIG domain-containing protein [Acidovorax sp. 107]
MHFIRHLAAAVLVAVLCCPLLASTLPAVTSVAPTEGLTMGWTQVVFTGTNLGSTSAVRFDGVDATNLFVDGSGTRVTATTPAHARGTVAVELVTAQGTAAAGNFTYVPQPDITNWSPGGGSMLGGTVVTITGSGFTGASTVLFGSQPATSFTVDSDTQITAVAPPQAAGLTVMFEVATPIAHMPHPIGYFTYTVPPELRPTVTSVAPTEGLTMGWTQVVFTGTNLGSTSAVRFDGVDATNLFVDGSGTRVTATTPAHARGTVAVELVTAQGTAAAGNFTYVPQPDITNWSPGGGSMLGGTVVTITGSGFTGASTVLFGSQPATSFTVDSDTQITAVAPPQAAGLTVMFEVATPIAHMPHPIGYFTYTVPPELRPTVTSVAPRWNPPAGGVPVVLTGANLTGTTAVRFAGQPALSFTVDSATQVTAIPPPAPLQSGGVEITTSLGTAQGFFLYALAPVLASASPATGPTTGDTPVTLRGSGLLSTTGVSFGGVAARSFNVVDDTRIDAVTPAHAAGSASVQVVAESGTAMLDGTVFTFTAPAIDGACGAADGLERVTPPTVGLCSAGVAGSVAAASGAFAWTCAGQNGGASSRQCNASWPMSGVGGLRASLTLPDPAANQGWGLDAAAFDATLPAPLPSGASTQHRALRLVLSGGGVGSSAQFTVQYSEPVAAGAVYLKYGPSPPGLNCAGAACAQPHWYALPGNAAVFAPDRRSVTLTLTDGGLGDTDAVPGRITDPGLPVLLAGAGGGVGLMSVPVLGPGAVAGLALLLVLPLFGGLGHRLSQKK